MRESYSHWGMIPVPDHIFNAAEDERINRFIREHGAEPLHELFMNSVTLSFTLGQK